MIRSSPPVSRRLVSSSERLLAKGLAGFAERFELSEQRSAARSSAGPDIFAVWPRFVKNFVELLENAGRLVNALSIPGAAAFRSVNTGVVCSAKRCEAFHRRPELFEERREQSARLLRERATVAALACATVLLCTMKSATLFAHARERRERLVGVDREFREHLVLARRGSPARLSSSRSAGLARLITSLQVAAAPARPAPSSLRMIVKRWRSGRRLMSPSRSTSTGLCVFCTGSRYSPAPSWPLADLLQRRRQRRAFDARLGRQAVDVLLADQRLRADRAAGVGAEVLEAGVCDVRARPRPWPAASA